MNPNQSHNLARLDEAASCVSTGDKVHVESVASMPKHVIAMNYTVKNSFIDDRASEVSAVSHAATWCTRLSRATCPNRVVQESLEKHEARSALAPRKQIDELIDKEIAQDGKASDFGGESGKRVLSALMEELPDMRAASIWTTWIHVLRADTQRLGLSLNNTREFIEKLGSIAIRFSPEDESAVLLCIRALGALAAATDVAAKPAFLVLVPLLGVAHSVNIQTAALSELFEGLKPALLLEFWEIEEANMDAEQWQARHLLESLGQIALPSSLKSLDTSRVRLLAWAQAGGDQQYGQRRMLQMRFKLIAILFGASTFVMLLQKDNAGLQIDFCHCDENFVYAVLRVFTELKILRLLGGAEAKQVVAAVIDPSFKPEERLCHAACAGFLGELCAGTLGELSEGKVDNLVATANEVDRIITQIVESASYWWSTKMLRGHLRDFMFESLWALKLIFGDVDMSATRWADQCLLLVQGILNDHHYDYCRREWPGCDEDKLMILASELQRSVDMP